VWGSFLNLEALNDDQHNRRSLRRSTVFCFMFEGRETKYNNNNNN
jgi:hypothetical protein